MIHDVNVVVLKQGSKRSARSAKQRESCVAFAVAQLFPAWQSFARKPPKTMNAVVSRLPSVPALGTHSRRRGANLQSQSGFELKLRPSATHGLLMDITTWIGWLSMK